MDAYIGEIRAFPYNYVPQYWLACDGSLLPIPMYQALFTLIGYTFGGKTNISFALPNLSANQICGTGNPPAGLRQYAVGTQFGSSTVALTTIETPTHTHTLQQGFVGGRNAGAENVLDPAATAYYNHPVTAANVGNASLAPPTAAKPSPWPPMR